MKQHNFAIVSGGQTGVERGALIAALERGVRCDGWCAHQRVAEDGAIAAIFPLRELDDDFPHRVRRNIGEANGNLLIFFNELEGGAKLVGEIFSKYAKPTLEIDGHLNDTDDAATLIAEFVREHNIERLNVSGPRASKHPAAESWTRAALRKAMSQLGN